MKFVVVGFGRVGSRTAVLLRGEGHRVIVVDADADRTAAAEKRGFEVVRGDGRSSRVLADAGLEEADGIAALTGDADVDFEACMAGKEHGARTVMRVGDDYVRERYEAYATHVDELVSPERLGAAAAKTALLGGDMEAIAELSTDLTLAVVTVTPAAPVVGARVNAIDLNADARVYAHGRGREPMTIPLPGTAVAAGDRLALLVKNEAVESVRERLLGNGTSR